MKLPQDLDQNANDWREYVQSLEECKGVLDLSKHIPETFGVYIAIFEVRTKTEERFRYYVGRGNPPRRANEHRSEFRNCKTTTRTGKSKLYTETFLKDAVSWRMHFSVHSSGHDLLSAKNTEKIVAAELTAKFKDLVITKPTTRS